MTKKTVPSSILIVGSGVFGLSTALSLASVPKYNGTKITLIDRSAFPAPDGASIDSSRIIRPDYACEAYFRLGWKAQELWRSTQWGADGRYSESGLALTCNDRCQDYVRDSFENVRQEAGGAIHGPSGKPLVEELCDAEAIRDVLGSGGGSGSWGYINRSSGWADAEAAMRYARSKLEATGRVECRKGEVKRLLQRSTSSGKEIAGVELIDGSTITAELTVLTAGAWSGRLVDLRGRVQATGQVVAYVRLTPEEQERLQNMPVLLNLSTGMFIFPPRNCLLKVARHGYGYSNPVKVPHPEKEDGSSIHVSLPRTTVDVPTQQIPHEGEQACRQALQEMVPGIGDREWLSTRICWYSDTPEGDWLVDFHPEYNNTLFVATGDSGHGFKFLPVLGDQIVAALEGHTPTDFADKWCWPAAAVDGLLETLDGSRSGPRNMILDQELAQRDISRSKL
ncbi:FAD dependent oxidoreductase [Xylona heveae TC161]|uniref:FAD dependent oxidoreductase n=1 Tax=Xylona heveae (strain CBS 132557 / TC161) TaxID=1328760 RepID=A0A165GR08_XYLHT|nr:FAD dependent oxidoreductase [Xylona heveae TC161]KZF22486.1 FAD dependent oxidoreductase [Xylona heveae TC161]